MARPKVLLVVHSHPAVRPGGGERYALELYKALRKQDDFEPVLVARIGPESGATLDGRDTPISMVDGDPNQYFVFTSPKDFDFFTLTAANKSLLTRHFADFLLAQRPDVVHFQHTLFLGNDLISLTRRILPDVPILYTLHEYLAICHRHGQMIRTRRDELCTEASPRRCHECFPGISPQQFFLRKRLTQAHFEHVDLFVAPSRFLLERYVAWGIPRDRIRYEKFGDFPFDESYQAERQGPHDRLGFFGQLSTYKGVTVLLEAMKLLAERGSSAHLSLHGANLEIQPEDFQAEFNELLAGAASNVSMLGRYEHRDVPRLMAEIDWVVMPSTWWENSPLVIQEAFQHGRPVICSDIGGMAEKIQDGVNGLHFHVGNPRSLAEVIERATSTTGLWQRLVDGIPALRSMDDHTRSVSQLYTELLNAATRSYAGAAF